MSGQLSQPIREITFRGIVIGALITMVFTASNIYLGLKVGLTFSSSIPAAVISMAVLSFFAHSNILENNMVQTQASAAGTLSSVIFVIPALLVIGYWQSFHFWQTMMICVAGGFLGVIFSIPLRRTMVVNSSLPYPEGVAAAQVLKVGHSDKAEDQGGAKEILSGAVIAGVISFLSAGAHVMSERAALWFHQGRAVFQAPMGFSLALVSAGYLMGVTAGVAMLLGMILTWAGLVPVLSFEQMAGAADLDAMSGVAQGVWAQRVRLVGAGLIAVAAIWTLLTMLKPMWEGIRLSLEAFKAGADGSHVDRTDMDMSSKSLLMVTLVSVILLGLVFHSFVMAAPLSPVVGWGLVAFAVVVAFIIGFFIAAACGYMAGLIGSSNSPISGIGIIAVIVTSLLLLLISSGSDYLGGPDGKRFVMALALFVTTAVVAVACIANDNLQDLKTGYLVGATPKNQQIALLIGCVVGAMVIAPVLEVLYQAYGLNGAPVPREGIDHASMLSAPQATLMARISEGVFSHNLDWPMISLGLAIGAVVIVIDTVLGKMGTRFRVPALAFGLGIYLPAHISAAIFVGSMLKFVINRRMHVKAPAADRARLRQASERKGVLFASGLIVGESLMGVFLAIAILVSLSMGYGDSPFGMDGWLSGILGSNLNWLRDMVGLVVFVAICMVFYRKATRVL